MDRICRPFAFFGAVVGFCLSAISSAAADVKLPGEMRTFLDNFCSGCHDAGEKKGGLDLDGLMFDGEPGTHAKWVRVFDRVLAGEMPPPKKQRPAPAVQRAFLTNLGTGLLKQHEAMKGTVLRRLNRTEYENTLRDLLGMRVDVRDILPEDSLSHGFDNVGEALGMSDVQLGRYMDAAEIALSTVLQRSEKPTVQTFKFDYTKGVEAAKSWLLRPDGAVVIFNNGNFPDTTMRSFRAPSDGMYKVRVSAYAYQSQNPITFSVYSGLFGAGTGSGFHGDHVVDGTEPRTVSVDVWLRGGETLRISPHLDARFAEMQKVGPSGYSGPGLAIKGVEIEGPIFEVWPPRGAELLFGDLLKGAKEADDKKGDDRKSRAHARKLKPIFEVTSSNVSGDAGRLLKGFVAAAFRRPVDDSKVAPYLALFESEIKRGSTFSVAMRTAAIGVLCSPDFLYLKEPAGKLDGYALATRLSYFLTRSAPDETLMKVAASGRLKEPAVLREQTERLLASQEFSRFVTDFTDAWLNLRDIDFTTPDKKLYPEFDEELQRSMLLESRAYFRELIQSNLSPTYVLKGDFAMLNQRLAEHYGIAGVKGSDIRKVKLPENSKRGGVLTQGAVLKVSANGTNSSPVIRGTWVLERILGVQPPPPPPGVPGVEPDIRGATTLREQLAKHRQLETCNGCHRVLDPPGFALENYDVIGGWREQFRTVEKGTPVSKEVNGRKVTYRLGPPVDATGELVEGGTFKNLDEFQNLILKHPDRITKCMAEKLLTFGSGRELGFSDRNEVTRIATTLNGSKGGLRDLIHLVVASPIFQSK